MTTKLLEVDGENLAVRWFLAMYGSNTSVMVPDMRNHLRASGFDGYWPEWAERDRGHLTKSGAQDWLRYLFGKEAEYNAADLSETTLKDNESKAQKFGYKYAACLCCSNHDTVICETCGSEEVK